MPVASERPSVTVRAIALMVADRVAASHPHPRFGPANVVTLLRGAGTSALLGLAAAGGAVEGEGSWVAALGTAVLLALAPAISPAASVVRLLPIIVAAGRSDSGSFRAFDGAAVDW